jgi:hypothetical protein
MKKRGQIIVYFGLGVLFMATLQQLTRCSQDEDWFGETINPEELSIPVDVKKIDAAVDELKVAFNNTDQSAIDKLTLQESLDLLKGKTTAYTREELEKIGKAMEKAKRTVTRPNYVEYNYIIDGTTYTFTMATDDNGNWKLLNY